MSLKWGVLLATALSCRTPTEIDVSLQGRGLTCEDGAPFAHFESGVLVRERFTNQDDVDAALKSKASYATSSSCEGLSDPELTSLGNAVVVPADLPERVEILAVAGFDRDPNDGVAAPSVLQCLEFFDPGAPGCPSEEPARSECRSCIFATRSLAFLEFSSLKLSVELDTRCAGKICPEGETCFQGECESNAVSCEGASCSDPGEIGGGGVGGAPPWQVFSLDSVGGAPATDLYGITSPEGPVVYAVVPERAGLSAFMALPGADPELPFTRVDIAACSLGSGAESAPLMPSHVDGPEAGVSATDVTIAGVHGGAYARCTFELGGSWATSTLQIGVCPNATALTGFSGTDGTFGLECGKNRSIVRFGDDVLASGVAPAVSLLSPAPGEDDSMAFSVWSPAPRRTKLALNDSMFETFEPFGFIQRPSEGMPLSAHRFVDGSHLRLLTLGFPGENTPPRLNTLELEATSNAIVLAESIATDLDEVWGLTTTRLGRTFLFGSKDAEPVVRQFMKDDQGWTRCALDLSEIAWPDAASPNLFGGAEPLWADDSAIALAIGDTLAIHSDASQLLRDCELLSSDVTSVVPAATSNGTSHFLDVVAPSIDLFGVDPTEDDASDPPLPSELHIATGDGLLTLGLDLEGAELKVSVRPFGRPALAVGGRDGETLLNRYLTARLGTDAIEVCDLGECSAAPIDCPIGELTELRVAGSSFDDHLVAAGGATCSFAFYRDPTGPTHSFTTETLAGIATDLSVPRGHHKLLLRQTTQQPKILEIKADGDSDETFVLDPPLARSPLAWVGLAPAPALYLGQGGLIHSSFGPIILSTPSKVLYGLGTTHGGHFLFGRDTSGLNPESPLLTGFWSGCPMLSSVLAPRDDDAVYAPLSQVPAGKLVWASPTFVAIAAPLVGQLPTWRVSLRRALTSPCP